MEPEENTKKARQAGGQIGRLAGRWVKNAGPRTRQFIDESRPKLDKAIQDARPKVEKAIKDYRPKVEQAGRDAVKYAQEHEDEIRGLAMKGARMRLGPLGMAIDALGLNDQPQQAPEQSNTCLSCQTVNTQNARFCSQCGSTLSKPPTGAP